MSVEPTEIEELRGPVLGIIDAYGMGDSVDPRKLHLKTAPATPPPPVHVRSRTTSAKGRGPPEGRHSRTARSDVEKLDEGVFRHRRSVVASETWGKGGHLP